MHPSPPGPAITPGAQALMWIGRPYDFMRECALEFGDTFKLQLGSRGSYVVFSDPDALRTIFTAGADVLGVGAGNAVLEPFVGRGSLLLLEGDRHIRERRLLMPAFHQKVILGYGETIRRALSEATADWAPGREFVAQELLQGVSIDVILRAVFGLQSTSACAELKQEIVSFLNDRRFSLGLMDQLRGEDAGMEAFRARLGRIRSLTMEFVTTRRRQGSDDELHDLLTMLLHAKDESGQGRSDEELRDELLTLVATGYETTATALAWGLYWIAADAAVRGRIRDEVAELGSDPDPGEYARLEYLDAVTKEILRIYPIVPFVFRQVVQPFSAAGYTFEPDTILAPCVYLTHHREGLYDRPDSFDPGRFLGRAYSPYEYLPFGGGSRRCIGMNLAIYEMKLIIALIFARFDLESTSQVPLVPVRRSVTMGPSGGGRMVVRHGCS